MSQNVEKHWSGEVLHPPRYAPPGRAWWEPKFIKKVTSEIGGSMMPKIGIGAPLGGTL